MSENKFIKQLQGKSTKKSVLEIKKSGSTTSFANMPNGTSNSINTYSDSRDDAVAVLKGAENWKLATNSLQLATTVNGDGRDFVSTYTAFGNTTWVNATYTFDSSKRFAPHTKFVLKLCGHSLQSSASKIIGFTLLVKFGNDIIMTKNFDVAQEAFEFCKNFDIDFGESNNDFIKVENNDTMTVQLLCQDSSASATIYNGMTVFTVLQRRVDSDSISSDTYTMEEIEEDLEEIHQELNGKVNIDGTSIMTGPLKMRSSISFKCAIAPSWDGVGFYKLNDNDSLTLMASMETTDGLCPATNNTYNIGKTSHKWKDLYLAGKAYVATINNGGDIAVPTISGTMALMSDVELAANSGSQLYTTGVWYAKMYAATVVPTGAEYDGKNYADFSQVDQDNNPIIVIYEGQNGSWVQVDTITPPATYNGYLYITSKIWDIVEQTNQQGGQVLWSYSQKTFTPYPRIVSVADLANTDLSNLSTTGKANVSAKGTYDPGTTYTSGTVGAELAKIAGKADAATTLSGYGITDGANTDLSNLTDTGKNIANWSSNVSNCITEIPQDVKLELNNGTLTLKAGSKVYVPNGAGVFNEVVIASDINISMGTGSYRKMIFVKSDSTVVVRQLAACYSGSPAPSAYPNMAWYDTTNNLLKITDDSGSTWTSGYSLPIAIATVTSDVITSIDQVFNGFGYIGSTVFVLPGVKVLIPDGKNSDGTLKNIIYTTNVVKTSDVSTASNFGHSNLVLKQNAEILPTGCWYDRETNYIFNSSGIKQEWCIIGHIIVQEGRQLINSFYTKKVFIALDRNDREYIAHQAMPSDKYVGLTLGASGSTYTAPADGYLTFGKDATDYGQYLVLVNNSAADLEVVNKSASNAGYIQSYIVAKKGDSIRVEYTLAGSTHLFRFIYANGAH